MMDRIVTLFLVLFLCFGLVYLAIDVYGTLMVLEETTLTVEEQLWIVIEYIECDSNNGEWSYDTGCHLEEVQ